MDTMRDGASEARPTIWRAPKTALFIADLYELDGWLGLRILNDDDKLGTLFFPTLNASTTGVTCHQYDCTDSSQEGPFKARKFGDTTSVSASEAIRITGAVYTDALGQCRGPLADPGCRQ